MNNNDDVQHQCKPHMDSPHYYCYYGGSLGSPQRRREYCRRHAYTATSSMLSLHIVLNTQQQQQRCMAALAAVDCKTRNRNQGKTAAARAFHHSRRIRLLKAIRPWSPPCLMAQQGNNGSRAERQLIICVRNRCSRCSNHKPVRESGTRYTPQDVVDDG